MPSTYAAGTHVGTREQNEDSFVCDPGHGLWFIADGVGGLDLGEAASAICAHTVATMISSGQGVNQSIEAAHVRIKEYSDAEANGVNMGTTLVLLLSHGSRYNVFWAGDCRAYLFDGTLNLITRDHTHLQTLLDSGGLTSEQAVDDSRKYGITKALGIQELNNVRADSMSEKWQSDQKILMCSDGLHGSVTDDEIERILNSPGSDQDRIDNLIEKALSEGATDNITIVLVSAPPSLVDDHEDDTEVPDDLE